MYCRGWDLFAIMIHIVKVFVMEGRMEEKQWKGMGLAIMGALFWGLSGTSVQFLENAKLKSHLYQSYFVFCLLWLVPFVLLCKRA